jgi:hypothetical protein
MNIQNIASLAEQLQSLGFENISSSLLKKICFRPYSFSISQIVEKGKEQLRFDLFFEKDNKQNSYVLVYYDAILQKETAIINTIINGVNTSSLESKMAEIDWKIAFELDTKKQWSVEDKSTWEKELKIESIIEDLISLEVSEEGKTIAMGLKLKYWNGVAYQELFGNLNPLKNRSEISQRFYFSEGQTGISVDEACRFLQNKWLEKQMQSKRKQTDDSLSEEAENENQPSSASAGNLLKKKRSGKTKAIKTKKSFKSK